MIKNYVLKMMPCLKYHLKQYSFRWCEWCKSR